MALPPAEEDTPAPAFTWGAGGGRMTPEQIAAQRKVAAALGQQGSDYSPIRSVWQGLARAAHGLNAGLAEGRANAAESANASENAKMIAALIGGGGASAAPAAAVPAESALVASAAPAAADTSGKVYTNDEPSPLDPPSGADRDALIRTVYGEAGNEPPQGQQAVASVIRNRAVDGGYGGDTPSAVVHAPGQFEPWAGGPALARMQALSPSDPKYAAISKVVDAAYRGEDPTEGMTHFYSPAGQAALGRPAPSWAGGDSVTIGGHVFNSPDDAAGKPVQVASADPAQVPANAAPTQGYAVPGQAVAKVSGALSGVNPAVLQAMTSPYADSNTKQIAGLLLAQQMKPQVGAPYKDPDGNLVQKSADGTVHMLSAADKTPGSVREFEYGQQHPEFATAQLAKTKAGAAQLNNQNNVDLGSSQTYDKQLAEGLGKAHAALANGVEDSQTRARDLAAMQGAVDQIQKAGGTTGGLAPEARLNLQKSINAGANALGISTPFSENDISDKEFLTKFNRSIAGAAAKNAVGSRVTNFEMSNYLKANPGLDMSLTGNQRLIGISSQVEQRNIAVGNAIREATAQAISGGKKIDPVTVQKIITDYDQAHHIQDPVTGQDLTQNYALPEFQQGNNAGMAVGHEQNINGIKVKRLN